MGWQAAAGRGHSLSDGRRGVRWGRGGGGTPGRSPLLLAALAGRWAQQPAPPEEFAMERSVQTMHEGLGCSNGAAAELEQTET